MFQFHIFTSNVCIVNKIFLATNFSLKINTDV